MEAVVLEVNTPVLNKIICPKCKEPRIIDEFHRDATRASGRQSICKYCRNSRRNGLVRERFGIESQVCVTCGKDKALNKHYTKQMGASGILLGFSKECKTCADKNRLKKIEGIMGRELVKINLFPEDEVNLFMNKYPVKSDKVPFPIAPMFMCDLCGNWEYPDRIKKYGERKICLHCFPVKGSIPKPNFKELHVEDYTSLKDLLKQIPKIEAFKEYSKEDFKIEASVTTEDKRVYSIAVIHFNPEKGINNTLAMHTEFSYDTMLERVYGRLTEIKNYNSFDWVD